LQSFTLAMLLFFLWQKVSQRSALLRPYKQSCLLRLAMCRALGPDTQLSPLHHVPVTSRANNA
jgi:hypothetical protein